MMTRYGVNVLPVFKGDKYSGLISREVVEKALFHGFGKGKSIDFATTDAFTVSSKYPDQGDRNADDRTEPEVYARYTEGKDCRCHNENGPAAHPL